jgi:transposase
VGRDSRDDRIAALEELVERLLATIERQAARITELEEKLRRSSRNSSKPPSSDGPATPPRQAKPRSGRDPGGQLGHESHAREPEPSSKADKIVACVPKRCGACGGRLHGEDPSPLRHQVFDLPKVVAGFVEYQLHALSCDCGHVTRAPLPPGVPRGAFGPGVVAVVAVLMGVYRLSKRMVPDMMADLFGLRMSVGAAVGCQTIASEAIATPVEDARAYVVEQPIKHADETGWREGARRSRAWLWVVATRAVVVFMIHGRRNSDAARAVLGRIAGVLVSDRHGAYGWWPDRLRQLCWAHLARDVQAIIDRGGESGRIGRALQEEIHRMFHWWHRVRDGTLTRKSFQVYMRSLRIRFEAMLEVGSRCDHSKTAKTCANLLKHACSLWTFVRVEGVEPTNNFAEQVVRHGVLLRKVSYGTHSEAGSRFIERILTVHATLRRQQRDILGFLREACEAQLNNCPPPSLLPATTIQDQLAIAA